jgi:hypothetical protein
MTSKPSSNATRLSLIAQAAQHSANENPDSSMQAVADRAAEHGRKEAQRFATRMIKEGKAGFVTDGKNAAIIER